MNPLGIKRHVAAWTLQGMHAAGIRTVRQNLIGGGMMILDTNDHLARRLRCEEAFEPEVRQEFERIASRGVNVVDIGANIGYYTILASRLAGPDKRVFSFEPQANMVNKLRRNIEANALRNVDVFQCALQGRNGVSTGLLLNLLKRGVDNALSNRALSALKNLVRDLGDEHRFVDRVDRNFTTYSGALTRHYFFSFLAP